MKIDETPDLMYILYLYISFRELRGSEVVISRQFLSDNNIIVTNFCINIEYIFFNKY
jgi:hypothetical protein